MDFSHVYIFVYFPFVTANLLLQRKIHFFCTSLKLSAMPVFWLFITVEGSREISLRMLYIRRHWNPGTSNLFWRV